MSDKFVKKVNAPIKKLVKKRKDIMWRPANSGGEKAAKTAKLIGLGATQTIYWLLKYTLLTNHALRWGEDKLEYIDIKNKDGKTNRFKAINRRFPSLSAHLYYYMLLAGLIGGGNLIDNINTSETGIKTERRVNNKKDIDVFKVNPMVDNDAWKKTLAAVHPYVLKEVIQSEGFVHEMYADVGQKSGYLTIGSGFMVGKVNPKGPKDRAILKEKKDFFKKVLGRPLVNGTEINDYENQVLVGEWLKQRVYPSLKKNFTQPVSVRLWQVLCVAAYNRGEGIFKKGQDGYPITVAINNGESEEVIANMLSNLFVTGNGGLVPKYGVSAHVLLGNISDADVLNSLANSPYRMRGDSLWNGKKLRMEYADGVASDLLKIKNADIHKNGRTYKQRPVKEYMTSVQVDTILLGKLFSGHSIDFAAEFVVKAKQEQQNLPENVKASQTLNEEGENLYWAGDCKGAVKKYKEALRQDPNNFIVYSNISIAYYKDGEFEDGLKVMQDLMKSANFKDIPDNIKAYTYYNAALCREGLGDNEKKLTKKLEHYNKAKINVENAEELMSTEYDVFNERVAEKIKEIEVNMKKGIKKLSFEQGGKKLNTKSKPAIQIQDIYTGRA